MAGSRFSIEAVISMIDRVTGPMKTATGSVKRFSGASRSSFLGLGSAAKSALGFLGVAGGAGLVYMGMRKIATEAMNFESSVANFTTLLGGSQSEAKKLVNSLQVLGAQTPFEFKDLSSAAQRLLGFGVVSKETVIPTLRMLGDLAQGNAEKLQGISLVYGQIMAGGKMMGQDFNQLINQGVPIAQGLAKVWGVDVNEAIKRVKQNGPVAARDVQAAMVQMTSKGGLFYGGMIRSSQTLAGLWSTFQDAISMTAAGIGAELLPVMKETVISMTESATKVLEWVQNNKSYIKGLIDDIKSLVGFLWDMKYVILAVIAAWGGYRIACKAARAATVSLFIIQKLLEFMEAAKILGFAGAIKYYTIGTKAAAVATKAFTIAQWAINAALTANPIGLIVVGIAAMIALVVLAIKYWDDWGAALVPLMGPIGILLSTVMAIKSHWGNITSAFENGGVLAGIKAIGMMLLDVVLYPLQKIIEVLARVTPGAIGRRLRGAAEMINDFRQGGLTIQNQNQAEDRRGFAQASGGFGASPFQPSFASPMSSPLGGGRTFGQLDINVNAPKGLATTRQSGTMPQGSRINKGAQ